MLLMQSQIKVSVALMNKRVQPICAAAETERFYGTSEREKKVKPTHRDGDSATVAPQLAALVGPRPRGPAISLGNQWQNHLLVKIHEKDHSDLIKW